MRKFIRNILITVISSIFIVLSGYCADIDLSKSFVSDKAHILDQRLYSQLCDILKNLHNETSTDVIVITLNRLPNKETYATIESQVKTHYVLSGKKHDKWLMIILTTDPYRMNIRVGKGLKSIIKGSTIRAMNFEFLFSRLNNVNNNTLRIYSAGRDLYNTTLFLSELIADANTVRLHTSPIEPRNETIGDILYVLGGTGAQNIPRTDPTEKYIRRNNFHMVITILVIGLMPLGIRYRRRRRNRGY